MHLPKNVLVVEFDRRDFDVKLCSDLVIGLALHEVREHFLLAAGERVGRLFGAEEFNHFTRNAHAHRRPIVNELAQALHDRFFVGALEKIPGGAAAERLEQVIVVGIMRQHDDFHLRHFFFDDCRAFVAAHVAGDLQIHQHDVGLVRVEMFDRGFAVGVVTRANKALGFGDFLRDAQAGLGVVVYDDYAGHRDQNSKTIQNSEFGFP